jgi:hypothetical protein
VNAVRVTRLDQVRPVVEDEESSVPCAGTTEQPRGLDEFAIRERFVAKLYGVDSAAQRRLEDTRVSRGEDEIEPHHPFTLPG